VGDGSKAAQVLLGRRNLQRGSPTRELEPLSLPDWRFYWRITGNQLSQDNFCDWLVVRSS
jgi:hypothetical protein